MMMGQEKKSSFLYKFPHHHKQQQHKNCRLSLIKKGVSHELSSQIMISGIKIPKEPGAVVLVGEDVDRSVATKLLKSIRSISNEFKSCVSPVVVPESR